MAESSSSKEDSPLQSKSPKAKRQRDEDEVSSDEEGITSIQYLKSENIRLCELIRSLSMRLSSLEQKFGAIVHSQDVVLGELSKLPKDDPKKPKKESKPIQGPQEENEVIEVFE
jgi:hypothetical protein